MAENYDEVNADSVRRQIKKQTFMLDKWTVWFGGLFEV